MVDKLELNLTELLEKNPEARKIFEENRKKMADQGRRRSPKVAAYGLALPYSGGRLVSNGESKTSVEPRSTYQGR